MKVRLLSHPPHFRGASAAIAWLHLRDRRQQAIGALLPPAALMSAVLGAWRIGADLKFTNSFPIESGFFAHWMTWMGFAVLLEIAAYHAALSRTPEQQTTEDREIKGAPNV